jgi:hypothetical protein
MLLTTAEHSKYIDVDNRVVNRLWLVCGFRRPLR